jgi:hypothetical protein
MILSYISKDEVDLKVSNNQPIVDMRYNKYNDEIGDCDSHSELFILLHLMHYLISHLEKHGWCFFLLD